jgi:hypothetical protein
MENKSLTVYSRSIYVPAEENCALAPFAAVPRSCELLSQVVPTADQIIEMDRYCDYILRNVGKL